MKARANQRPAHRRDSRARPAHQRVHPAPAASKRVKIKPPVVVACLARLHRARRRPEDTNGPVGEGRRSARGNAAERCVRAEEEGRRGRQAAFSLGISK